MWRLHREALLILLWFLKLPCRWLYSNSDRLTDYRAELWPKFLPKKITLPFLFNVGKAPKPLEVLEIKLVIPGRHLT